MVNLTDESAEKSPTPRAPKIAVLLMAVIMICLAILAVFANVQRSRRDAEQLDPEVLFELRDASTDR